MDPDDWPLFADAGRLRFVASIDESTVLGSASLDRVVRIASLATGSPFAQISLIGEAQLVPASHGIEYSSADQHSPPEDSLCTLTMASGGTLRLPDTRRHPDAATLPPVTEGGVRSYLGVPLHDTERRPIGAICVFDEAPRDWTETEVATLEDLAELVTRELHLLAALETAAAGELRLRQVITDLVSRPRFGDGARLRARAHYAFPADAPAGGDWVDWIELPDRTAFSIGDVAGHGLGSIALMDELRHALRAYALESVDPSEAIAKTSDLLHRLRPDDMATAIKGDFRPGTGTVRLAVAGHPPPIHLRGDRAWVVDVRPSPPLGSVRFPPEVTELALEEGDRLAVFTDGVFERRGEMPDVGLRRLADALAARADVEDLEVVARAAIEALADELDDDACLLLIERPRA